MAIIIPIKAMNNRDPIFVRSDLVVYPATAITPNITDVVTKVSAIDEPV